MLLRQAAPVATRFARTLTPRAPFTQSLPKASPLHCRAMATAPPSKLRQPTIVDMVVVDHRNTLALLDQFDQAAQREDKQAMDSLVEGITLEIMLHSHAEEAVLYPFIEKRMGQEGKEFSQHSLKEHKKLDRELCEALNKRKAGGEESELAKTLAQIRKDFEHHLHDEEDDFLPKLQQQASVEELTELGPHFIQAKRQAALRPTNRQ